METGSISRPVWVLSTLSFHLLDGSCSSLSAGLGQYSAENVRDSLAFLQDSFYIWFSSLQYFVPQTLASLVSLKSQLCFFIHGVHLVLPWCSPSASWSADSLKVVRESQDLFHLFSVLHWSLSFIAQCLGSWKSFLSHFLSHFLFI